MLGDPNQENVCARTPDRPITSSVSGLSGLSAVSSPQMIESPKMVNIHQFMTDQLDEEEDDSVSRTTSLEVSARLIALEILQGIYDAIDFKAYANFLGAKDNVQILRAFVGILKPFPDSLLLVLRLLVSKVYFIAEAQNIDRILEELSKQWVESHKGTVWAGHYKLCHIVLFSLLILNSDLHNDETTGGSNPRFTCEKFVENTLFALNKEAQSGDYSLREAEPVIVDELNSYYESLKNNALSLMSKTPSKQLSSKASRQVLRTDSRFQNGHQLSKRTSKFSIRGSLLNSVDTSDTSSACTSIYSNSSSQIRKESHFTSNWKFHHNKPLPKLFRQESFDEYLNTKSSSLWFMDSVIKISDANVSPSESDNDDELSQMDNDKRRGDPKKFFRWLMKSKNKSIIRETKSPMAFLDDSAKWVKARIRVFEGRIYIFKLKSMSLSKIDESDQMDALKKNSSKYFVFNLFEALAVLVQANIVQSNHPSSHSSFAGETQMRGNFNVTIPSKLHADKKVLEFQTNTVGEAQQFVSCINFWAARLTPVPTTQFELVSNEEYGWSEKLLVTKAQPDEIDRLNLSSWKPLLSISSLYDEIISEEDQPDFDARVFDLEKFAEQVQDQIDKHNQIKPKMIDFWKDSRLFETAMDNWNKKYLYLNEINERSSTYLEIMKAGEQALHRIL